VAEISAISSAWLTVGEVFEVICGDHGAVLSDNVHAQVESHQVLGGKVDGGNLKFQKIINSNEIILGWLA